MNRKAAGEREKAAQSILFLFSGGISQDITT
jgi:hypothetical protein